jgi:hypothetical protein
MKLLKNAVYVVSVAFVMMLGIGYCATRDLEDDPRIQAALREAESEQAAKDSVWAAESARFVRVLLDEPRLGLERIEWTDGLMTVTVREYDSRAASGELAGVIAQRYSQLRMSHGLGSSVTVRILYDGLVMAEADARETRITAVR